MALTTPAMALNDPDCGPAVDGVVTCSGTYSNGLTYGVGGLDDLTVQITPGATVTTTNAGAHGLYASTYNGDLLINQDGVIATSGDYANGIQADSNSGDLTLTGVGGITVTGDNSGGVVLQNFGGDITATVGSISANGDNGFGIVLGNHSGSGDVTLTTSGTISATGVDGVGINAFSGGGSVTITNNADITAHSVGITARAATTLDITSSGAVSTTGDNARAIEGMSTDGAVSIVNTGSATTLGEFSTGLRANSETGAVVIDNRGVVSTAGFMAHGMDAATVSGGITLTNTATGVITTTGLGSVGIRAESETGAVSVTNLGSVTTSGDASQGISVRTTNADTTLAERGDVTLTNRGLVQTSGQGSAGIFVETVAGAITADISAVSTTGGDSDAVSLWTSTGDITLTTSGLLTTAGADSHAISTSTDTGMIDITNAADLETSGSNSNGIYAQAPEGTIRITNTGVITTTGDSSYGIVAQGEHDASVTTAAITTSGDDARGLYIHSRTGLAKAVVNGAITTTGDNSRGITASTDTGTVDILTLATISTSGEGSTGVSAYATNGDIVITTAAVTTTGYDAEGIEAESETGTVTVVANGTVSTAGEDADAIRVYAGGAATITTAAVTTTGYSSDAIYASTNTDLLKIVAHGLISTTADNSEGIDANNDDGDISVTVGSVSTKGESSTGIEAFSDDGVARIVSTGSITTEGSDSQGIDVIGGGGVFIDANSITTLGYGSNGITARSGSNTVTINVRSITASGYDSRGIDASSEVSDLNITAGAVAAGGMAIWAQTGEGDINVTTTGAVTSTFGEAVVAMSQNGDVLLNIRAGSILTSGIDNPTLFAGGPTGINTIVAEGATVTINNAGTINQGERNTLFATGQVTVNNSGLITGDVEFGAGDDVINNTGRFVLSGDSDFGGGYDRFVNTGLVTMRGDATLFGLERFVNAGTINLADGHAGDVLTISGDYVGTNGRLVLDLDAGAAGGPAYDRLVVGGSASGTTTVTLNARSAAALKPGAVLKLVDAAGGSTTGAFRLADEAANIGFSRYGVTHDLTADDFFIAATEGDAVFRSLKLNEGAQALWRQSADAWSAHTAALRDPTAEASTSRRVWGQVYAAADKRDETLNRTGNGVAQSIDLSYTQDHIGGQMGVDLGMIGASGVTYGLTGGYVESTLEFRDKADTADYQGFNLGAYVGAQRGRYFVNALAKYDLFDVQSRSATAGYDETLDGRGYGVQVETGARFNGEIETKAFFFEPTVSLTYSRTDLDSLAAQGAVVDFEALDGLRAKAGARVGGSSTIAQGTVAYALGAHLVRELAGEDGVRFTSGAANSAFDNNAVDAYGQYQLGLTFTSNGGLTGFVEARADVGDDYKAYTGRIGVRVSF